MYEYREQATAQIDEQNRSERFKMTEIFVVDIYLCDWGCHG